MRITTLKLLLSAIAASVVTMLAAGPAAATVGSCAAPVFLHLATPGTVLSEATPGAGTGTFVELPALRRSGGNPYQQFGEWDGSFESHADCSDVYDLQLWLGLHNSDDQGTNFDVKVELIVNDVSTARRSSCASRV